MARNKVQALAVAPDQARNENTKTRQSLRSTNGADTTHDVAMTDPAEHDPTNIGHAASPSRSNGTSGPKEPSSAVVNDDSDTGLELLGQGMKAFVTLIQDLRVLGVEELVLPLPKICVLGDQSTGKSSLIEGLSGIKVPRKAGTCTRCPLEINLATSGPGTSWKCSIYLVKSHIYDGFQMLPSGRSVKAQPATRARPLGPWLPQDCTETTFFYKTSNKSDIPHALHLAQLATLNPAIDPLKFMPGQPTPNDDRLQCKFSPNVIKLDITSPDVPNLYFYDLPGVINQAEVPEEEYLVKLVANLAKKYIRTENCLNLLAMPMTDDPANSTASKLVQEFGAQARTFGVLTKPDRVQSGESLAQWIDILNGKKFRAGHGYYVVKNNPDPEVSHSVARQEEDHFFSELDPWATELNMHSQRFGTIKLQSILSKTLAEQIRTSLPQIAASVHAKVGEIVTRLGELPEPPEGNLSLKIMQKIMSFESDLRHHLDGGSAEYPFQKEWYAAAVHFRHTIAFSYPRLNLSDQVNSSAPVRLPFRASATPTPSGHRHGIISIESDEEESVTQHVTPASHSKKRSAGTKTSQISPTKRTKLQDIPIHLPQDSPSGGSVVGLDVDRSAPYAKRFTLTEIRDTLQDAHVGLPNQIDPRATERMIRASLTKWDEPLDQLLSFTSEVCLNLILERATIAFSIWTGTEFFDVALEVCRSFLQEAFEAQKASAKKALAKERRKALTLHEDAMRAASERSYVTLESAHRNGRAMALLSKNEPGWDKDLDERAKQAKLAKVTDAQLGPNAYVHELRALSDVRGYFECACSRFVDVIYQDIHTDLFAACRDELGTALKDRLGLEEKDAEHRCAMLLAVDQDSARLRVELLKQKENLEKATVWLEMESR
ncbi:MAG: hypothetical protein Q9174_004598 [Haloplaca sp. 1 TL-2023]